MTQVGVPFPANPDDINRDMLTPPNHHGTEDDSETENKRGAADQMYVEETKGASFGTKDNLRA